MELLRRKRLLLGLITFLAGVTIYGFVTSEKNPSFSFLHGTNLIDLELTGGSRWFCYSESKPVVDVVDQARIELISKGYKEDYLQSPWFHFIGNGEEIVICQMGDYAVNVGPHGGLIHAKPKRPFAHPASSIWVRRPGGSFLKVGAFQFRKYLLFR